MDIQLKCKKDVDLVKTYEELNKNQRNNETIFQNLNDFKTTYINFYGANSHTYHLDEDVAKLTLSMSLEPTAEDINRMQSSCEMKSTELKMILIELILLTMMYAKDLRIKKD